MCARNGVSSVPHCLHFAFKIKGEDVAVNLLDVAVLDVDVLTAGLSCDSGFLNGIPVLSFSSEITSRFKDEAQ